MKKNKRWINPKEPGQTCYVTSTCLDFAHLFSRDEMKTKMALSLLRDCEHYGASLHAFVVMTHHIHLLVTPQPNETISTLMRNIKRRSANHLSPYLNEFELSQLTEQDSLNQHSFWKEGFRGLSVITHEVFLQKVNYIHQNPVRSKNVMSSVIYPWSSAKMYYEGHAADEYILDLAQCIGFYENLLKT